MSAYPPVVSITQVRWPITQAGVMLHDFVFNGYSAHRAPRGIDPEFVSYWLESSIIANCAPESAARVLDLLLFYERPDFLPGFAPLLTRQESDYASLCRSLYIVRAIGELGSPEQSRAGALYFSQYLLPHPSAVSAFQLLLDAAESLALTVDMDAVDRRLQSAPPALNFAQYARAAYPGALAAVEARRRLLTTPPPARLPELAAIYCNQSPLSNRSMGIFAAPLLRTFAMHNGQPAAVSALSYVLESSRQSTLAQSAKDFLVHRAAQAILYLRGSLSFSQELACAAVRTSPDHFLSDYQ